MDIMLKISRYGLYIYSNILLIFHRDIYNSFGDMNSQISKKGYPKGQNPQFCIFFKLNSMGGSYIQIYRNSMVIIVICKLFSIQTYYSLLILRIMQWLIKIYYLKMDLYCFNQPFFM